MDAFYRRHNAHRAPRRLRARRGGHRGRSRAPASGSPRSPAGDPATHDLHPQRDRGDQPRRLRLGARQRRPRRRGAHHRDGAPLEHRALAAALRGDGRGAALPATSPSRASCRSTSSTRCSPRGGVQAGRRRPRLERARHDQPGRRDRRARPRRRGAGAGRRLAGACRRCRSTWRAIDADFYAWTGHKALGPTGIGVLHGAARAARGDAAVPRAAAT